ncbi:MAG: hypothetical protein JW749_00655 [Sedimentisphaerales bacterium]|nr:hypothetical protein [Sedimentisphaerales bacterium]
MALLKADSEDEVIKILKEHGYWDDTKVWRLFGDREGSFATIGNQQSRPEAALTEKIINSIDARLMSECMERGIDPTSANAPKNIHEAVAVFFENKGIYNGFGGTLHEWDDRRRREVSEGITVALTGTRKNPSVTIADTGEGQTPNMMPDTFLSIDKQNKLRIPFVQGKFNMGGTGVLGFCGQDRFQLIITKRNPKIIRAMKENDESGEFWGVTLVRRESPMEEVKNSIYTYLAPEGANETPRGGKTLRFKTASLPLMPYRNEAYAREIEYGSIIKLYNYDMKGFASHACMKDGLLYRLEAMLPEPAVPIRIHECRDFRGHAGSFDTTLSGLIVRLEDNKAENLEEGFPDSNAIEISGQKMIVRIYAFKKGKAETYRTNEGIIFIVNGQTHGIIPKTIFSRQSVKMGSIADSLLVLVDCSSMSYRAREDLFMNSRDRLRGGEFRKELEKHLEEMLHQHPGLRELSERRKNDEIASRLEESKPLEDILKNILKSSPSLESLFLTGRRLPKPHKSSGGENEGEKGGNGDDNIFVGKEHPSFFRFKKRPNSDILRKECEVGRRCRLDFETDVRNDYFIRNVNRGRYILEILEQDRRHKELNEIFTLHNGYAHLSIDIPEEIDVGDGMTIQLTVTDDVILTPFVNIAILLIKTNIERPGGRGTKNGRGGGEGEEDSFIGIELPRIIPVKESDWNEHKFDQYSACKIVQDFTTQEENKDSYRFYINVDNKYLRTDMKYNHGSPKLLEAKYIYGNVLIGLGLIKDYRDREKKKENDSADEISVEDYVFQTTKALSAFILPMINTLGSLSEEEITPPGHIGDEQ